jgi:macrolide-specific efflux system membrane fusion protein
MPHRSSVPRWIGRLVLVGAGLSVGWVGARRSDAPGADAPVGGGETATIERRDIGATVLATGVIRAKVGAQVAVGSRASGVLKKLHVTIGDQVQAGQLLAELDPVEFETQVERADAARSNAAAERAYAESEFGRARQLAETGSATQAELTNAQRALETARAKEREATAALAAARVQLGYTRILAPISGVIATVSTQEGETVAASFAAPTFLTIVNLARLEVWAFVDETDIGRVKVGQRARFTVDTYQGEEFDGRVTAIRPTAEVRDNVVNYVTLIELENRAGKVLRPEMTTTVNIELDGRKDVVAVPNAALRRDAQGSYVLVPAAVGSERRNVRAGFRGTDFTELLSGVKPGERVVLGVTQPCQSADTEKKGA